MTDYNSKQRKRNMIVGAFVIVAFCAFLWMISIFGEMPVAVSKFRSFRIVVDFANAPGVQENTPVQYCGYQIGRVVSILPPFLYVDKKTDRTYHLVRVVIAIERKYSNIPSNVSVKLMRRGLGSSYIELKVDPDEPLKPSDPNRPESVYLLDDTHLRGTTGTSSEFFPEEVRKKLENLVDKVGSLAANVDKIVGDRENQVNIKKTLGNVAAMTEQANKTLKAIENFSNAGTETMKTTNTKIADISNSVVSGTEQLRDTLRELEVLLAKANAGDGTAARLLNDGRLYENLLDSSMELQMTLEQLKNLAAEAREKGLKIKW